MKNLNEYVNRNAAKIIGLTNHDAYDMYTGFCEERGTEAMSFRTFMIKLCTAYPFKTVQKCTRAGMMQIIEQREEDKGLSEFIEGRQAEDLDGQHVEDCYTRYTGICDTIGCSKMTKIDFSRKICATLGLKTKSTYFGGNYTRVFVKY